MTISGGGCQGELKRGEEGESHHPESQCFFWLVSNVLGGTRTSWLAGQAAAAASIITRGGGGPGMILPIGEEEVKELGSACTEQYLLHTMAPAALMPPSDGPKRTWSGGMGSLCFRRAAVVLTGSG